MKLVSDPAIADKIRKMKQRVQWQDPAIVQRGIDQTRFVLENGESDNPEFSFLVIGDSGSGAHRGHHPQREIAELMLPHHPECSFMLHTGDVVYLLGSSDHYYENFIKPYREFLVGEPKRISYDNMVFSLPILPVPGNHDYYDLPLVLGLVSLTTLPLRQLLQSKLYLDLGWHGSGKGDAYARAFLDYLKSFKRTEELARHLDEHYTAKTDTGRCLRYEPGRFTRLPNRYYTFRYGGIDFFALDSNTFNDPPPLADTTEGKANRRQLEKRRDELEEQKQQMMETVATLNLDNPSAAEQLDDMHGRVSQIEEIIVDIDKQLATDGKVETDIDQLEWLKFKLIQSWQTKDVRGRVIYLHHPPYVTEATKWEQGQTLAVRSRLRDVFNAVAQVVGYPTQDRPLVDLVLTGHAHCLEHIETMNTGSADSHIHSMICGGSGFSLRRQRPEGPDLMENKSLVARSHLFIGRNGEGSQKRRPYSCLRIDVKGGSPPKFIIRPLVAEWYHQQWHYPQIQQIVI